MDDKQNDPTIEHLLSEQSAGQHVLTARHPRDPWISAGAKSQTGGMGCATPAATPSHYQAVRVRRWRKRDVQLGAAYTGPHNPAVPHPLVRNRWSTGLTRLGLA
nr:unnamed protein product [Callosobruchus chinensis]